MGFGAGFVGGATVVFSESFAKRPLLWRATGAGAMTGSGARAARCACAARANW
jgi:hypothetical protein